MTQGRKPVPTLLNKLHGKPNKGRKPNPHEPKAVTGDLDEPPEWMTESQQAGWRYAIEHAPPGLLKRIDKGALTVWIAAEDMHRQALVAQSKMRGLLVEAPITKAPMQSPYLPIINRQGLIMLKAASELGFSPVARPRVGMMPSLPVPKAETGHDKAPRRSLEDFLEQHPTTH